jgi:hypothetical protein
MPSLQLCILLTILGGLEVTNIAGSYSQHLQLVITCLTIWTIALQTQRNMTSMINMAIILVCIHFTITILTQIWGLFPNNQQTLPLYSAIFIFMLFILWSWMLIEPTHYHHPSIDQPNADDSNRRDSWVLVEMPLQEQQQQLEPQQLDIDPPPPPPHENTTTQPSLSFNPPPTDETNNSTTTTSTTPTTSSPLVARKGNGNHNDLTPEQLNQCIELKNQLLQEIGKEWKQQQVYDQFITFLDEETCRRFLVARTWNMKKAKTQLKSALQWRLKEKPWNKLFKDSPGCLNNPFALSMRIVSLDCDKRPVVYACFGHAPSRWNADFILQHLISLMESGYSIITKQFRCGEVENASSNQWIWIIDFHGFTLWDQNPRSSSLVAQLMTNFPEMLNLCVLIDAPNVFNVIWSAISPLLDDRVRKKASFVSGKNLITKLEPRVGQETTEWILQEMKQVRQFSCPPRKYWIPTPEHDPRGTKTYVNSKYYVETPGEAYEKKQLNNASSSEGLLLSP